MNDASTFPPLIQSRVKDTFQSLQHHDTSDNASNGGSSNTSRASAVARVLQAGISRVSRGRANLNPRGRSNRLDAAVSVGSGNSLLHGARGGDLTSGNGATGRSLRCGRASRFGYGMLACGYSGAANLHHLSEM